MADMGVWMEGKNQEDAVNSVHIGDPLAAYLAYHPEVYPKYIELLYNIYHFLLIYIE